MRVEIEPKTDDSEPASTHLGVAAVEANRSIGGESKTLWIHPSALATTVVEVARLPSRRSKTLWIHPSALWLKDYALFTADEFLCIPGEIVSGHPDRHVMRVRIGNRTAYLKREHRVRLRDRFRHWCEGFGWVSKSAREARVLQQLEAARLPAPQVLAFGEDRSGMAFLLVEEVEGAIDLRRYLLELAEPVERKEMATRLGRSIAELHEVGFHYPDLYAKHILINPATHASVLLDWQRAYQQPPSESERISALASLNATLSDELVSRRDRLRMLWAYRRVLRQSNPIRFGKTLSFSHLARKIATESESLLSRAGIREQRQPPLPPNSQRLVWLDGEALCVIPELAEDFQNPILRRMIDDPSAHEQWLILSGNRFGKLEVHRYQLSLSRWWARLRGRAWRSPELRRGRLLFHLERHHILAPKLLAFGQREKFGSSATAFTIAEPVPEVVPLWDWYDSAEHPQRLHLLRDLGAFLAKLHEADCITDCGAAIAISEAESSNVPAISDINRLTFVRRLRSRQKLRHLARLWREIRLCRRRTEGLQILLGYLDQARLNQGAKNFTRSILREAR